MEHTLLPKMLLEVFQEHNSEYRELMNKNMPKVLYFDTNVQQDI